MAHVTTSRFWSSYRSLPVSIRALADKNYELLKENPDHPSLHFKRVSAGLWSVRVGRGYRALGVDSSEGIAWYWIGHHDEYKKLIES